MTEEELIGRALLDLSARLPDGYQDIGGESAQASMYLSYDAGDEEWEIEFCALDPQRNFSKRDRDLHSLMTYAVARDREVAADV